MKYSIIIPHYNRPVEIMNTIKSFQNLKNKEIIIVDDVSTKENLIKLKENISQLKDEHKIYIYESSNKLFSSGARNKGLDLAKGEWIFFIDDDDEVTPGFIKFLNKKNLNNKINFYRFPNIERLNGKNKMYIFKWWHKKYSPQFSTYLFNRDFLNKHNLRINETIKHGEDIFFQMELFEIKSIKSKYIHHFSFYYNAFNDSESMTRTKKQDPYQHLQFIDLALSTNYKSKKDTSLTFLAIYYNFLYKKNKYENKEEALKCFIDYYNKINPNFKTFLKINLPWKFVILAFRKEMKKTLNKL